MSAETECSITRTNGHALFLPLLSMISLLFVYYYISLDAAERRQARVRCSAMLVALLLMAAAVAWWNSVKSALGYVPRPRGRPA